MGDVIELPALADEWQFSVHVYRRPDGTMTAQLADARMSVIEAEPRSPREKLRQIADWLEAGIYSMREDAKNLDAK